MEQILTAQFWHDQWSIVVSAPWVIIPLLLIAASIGAVWRKTVDGGEIRGVNAQNNALKEQLALAHDRHDVVTDEFESLKPEITQLKAEVAELKTAPIPRQLEALATTTSVLADRMDVISRANTVLGRTFTFPGAGAKESPAAKPPIGPNSSQSDLLLSAKILTGGWFLDYNPLSPAPTHLHTKRISFNGDGTVGDGRNRNEFNWQINNGLLVINRENGLLQNKFGYDRQTERFVCTNDPSAKGIRDQIIYREQLN